MITKYALEIAHSTSINNFELIRKAKLCGCYYCKNEYPPSEVKEWIDGGLTAICPKCSVDAVIATEDYFEEGLLNAMYERWFGY